MPSPMDARQRPWIGALMLVQKSLQVDACGEGR